MLTAIDIIVKQLHVQSDPMIQSFLHSKHFNVYLNLSVPKCVNLACNLLQIPHLKPIKSLNYNQNNTQ